MADSDKDEPHFSRKRKHDNLARIVVGDGVYCRLKVLRNLLTEEKRQSGTLKAYSFGDAIEHLLEKYEIYSAEPVPVIVRPAAENELKSVGIQVENELKDAGVQVSLLLPSSTVACQVPETVPLEKIPAVPYSRATSAVSAVSGTSATSEISSNMGFLDRSYDPEYRPSDTSFREESDSTESDHSEVAIQTGQLGGFRRDLGKHLLSDSYHTEIRENLGVASVSLGDNNFICQKKKLLELLPIQCPKPYCNCAHPMKREESVIGCVLRFVFTCRDRACGHQRVWESSEYQETGVKGQGKVYSINLLFSAALLISGCRYLQVHRMLSFLNVVHISSATFHRHNKDAIFPAIRAFKSASVSKIYEELGQIGEPLDLAGDGQMDSPGHSAKYCSYSLLSTQHGYILDTVVVDKRETELKSPTMELFGLIRALEAVLLQHPEFRINFVATDEHIQIKKLFRLLRLGPQDMKARDELTRTVARSLRSDNAEQLIECLYASGITHCLDVWHKAKNISSKVLELSRRKSYRDLKPWVASIRNHFFFASEKCNGDHELMKDIWLGLLYHVQGIHSWASWPVSGCLHSPLCSEDHLKPTLAASSDAFQQLSKVIWSDKLLLQFPELCHFLHTTELEIFNSTRLVYSPKRNHFQYESMEARAYLALLDFNDSVHRSYRQQEGSDQVRVVRRFSKRSVKWLAVPVKEAKTYKYVPDLMSVALHFLVHKNIPEEFKNTYDPSVIATTIAPVEPPSCDELFRDHISRLRKSDYLIGDALRERNQEEIAENEEGEGDAVNDSESDYDSD